MAIDEAMPAGERAGQRGGRPAGFKPCAIQSNAVAALVPAKQAARDQFAAPEFVSQQVRDNFLNILASSGDPAVAAEQTGLRLELLFRLRAEDADFAARWHAAISFAWEMVEHRLLAQLLDRKAALDSKLALTALARRDQGTARVSGRPLESASVARLRAELQALTGPDDQGSAETAA